MLDDRLDGAVRKKFSSPAVRFASFLLALVIIVMVGILAYVTEIGTMSSQEWVVHTYRVRSELNDLQLELTRVHASESAYLLTREYEQLVRTQQQEELVPKTVATLRGLTWDNSSQQKRLNQLEPLLKEHMVLVEKVLKLFPIVTHISPKQTDLQRQIVESEAQIDTVVHQMQDEEQGLFSARIQAWNRLFRRSVMVMALAVLVAILMLAFNFRLQTAEVNRTQEMEERERHNAESYRALSAKILEMQDTERRRIARELHDSVGQFLAGLKINLSRIAATAGISTPPLISETLISETMDMTEQAIQEVRTISHLLHPPLLEELGLISAARWYAEEFGKRSQVRVSLDVEEPPERLPKELEMALFRVLQEALTNVHRHANAQSIVVRVECHNGTVVLSVSDDGRGIPYEVIARFQSGLAAGIGLAGMRERLAEFGGHLDVQSSNAGSVVRATIPTGHC
jgi:signal transduction histidine kinase